MKTTEIQCGLTETELSAQADEKRTREAAENMDTPTVITTLLGRSSMFELGNNPCIRILTDRILADHSAQTHEIEQLRDALNRANAEIKRQEAEVDDLRALVRKTGDALASQML